MAEPITLQKLVSADADADTLGEFANEDKVVVSRKGLEYPSAPMASRLLVENGLLGATPFSTYAAMTASALVDGDYAVVTNDIDVLKNGVYIKDSADFKLLSYSVQATAEKTLAASLSQVIYDTAGVDDVFAFTDKDGKIGVTFDKDANVNANNISIDDLGYALVVVDDDDNACLAIDKNGNLQSHTLTEIGNRITSLEEKSAGVVVDSIGILDNQKTDYMHIFSYGQSLSRGATAYPVISTTQPYSSVTFASGVLLRDVDEGSDFTSFKPLVEQQINGEGESPTSSLINNFVKLQVEKGDDANKWQMVGTAPGRGGHPIAWLNKGTTQYNGVVVQMQAAYDIAQSQNKSYSVWGLAWTQGENDYRENTTKQEYQNALITLHNDFTDDAIAITQQSFKPPLVMYQTAAHRRYERDTMQIALAQLQLHIDVPDMILACPIYHIPHNSDDLHLTADSSYQLGRYYAKALDYTLSHDRKWQPLRPTKVLRQNKVIDIEFSRDDIVFDTTLVAVAPNMGFDIWSADAVVDIISSVTIVDKNRVRIVLSANPPPDAILSYARGRIGDPQKSGNLEGPRGNLRDNAGGNDNYQDSTGTTRYMHNWCVMFEQSI